MEENNALMKLYETIAHNEAENSRRWHKQLIWTNIIWAIIVVALVIAHFVYESQFTTLETSDITTTITQENEDGNNVYQPGERAIYNEGGD